MQDSLFLHSMETEQTSVPQQLYFCKQLAKPPPTPSEVGGSAPAQTGQRASKAMTQGGGTLTRIQSVQQLYGHKQAERVRRVEGRRGKGDLSTDLPQKKC